MQSCARRIANRCSNCPASISCRSINGKSKTISAGCRRIGRVAETMMMQILPEGAAMKAQAQTLDPMVNDRQSSPEGVRGSLAAE